MLFGGFFINVNQIPIWLSWIRHVSFIKYGFSAAMHIEFRDRVLDASGCVNQTFCPADGNAALEFYKLMDLELWESILILIGYSVIMRLIAYFILYLRGPKYDKSI
jgi:hypothetical protein